jgi:hypothetical protein
MTHQTTKVCQKDNFFFFFFFFFFILKTLFLLLILLLLLLLLLLLFFGINTKLVLVIDVNHKSLPHDIKIIQRSSG